MQKLILSLLLISHCFADFVVTTEGAYLSEEHLEIVARFLPEDPIIFEAGGHYGNDTVRFSKRWPLSQIYSFEPNPNAFQKLGEATLNLPNVHAYNVAVNNYNGFATLHICYGTNGNDPIFEGASSLLEASDHMKIHYKGPDVTVPCVVLDDWCEENGIDHIDFMWLDLEGLELRVLQSSPQILDTVKVIYTETNFQAFRVGMAQYRDLREFLEKNRFKLISHWYTDGYQGNAIFVKKEPFEN